MFPKMEAGGTSYVFAASYHWRTKISMAVNGERITKGLSGASPRRKGLYEWDGLSCSLWPNKPELGGRVRSEQNCQAFQEVLIVRKRQVLTSFPPHLIHLTAGTEIPSGRQEHFLKVSLPPWSGYVQHLPREVLVIQAKAGEARNHSSWLSNAGPVAVQRRPDLASLSQWCGGRTAGTLDLSSFARLSLVLFHSARQPRCAE